MISKLIENFKNIKIAVIGDLMLDEYIMGKVDRISPEAPVPVVKVIEENPNVPNRKHQFFKETSPEGIEFTNSFETKRAIIGKYTEMNNTYDYTFVSKKNKVKNCYISVYYATNGKFSDTELEKVCNKFLDEAESFLK